LFSREFYEAARDLDSQPPPRADHVEACRPRGMTTTLSIGRELWLPEEQPKESIRPA
jgi:hypothetical protein